MTLARLPLLEVPFFPFGICLGWTTSLYLNGFSSPTRTQASAHLSYVLGTGHLVTLCVQEKNNTVLFVWVPMALVSEWGKEGDQKSVSSRVQSQDRAALGVRFGSCQRTSQTQSQLALAISEQMGNICPGRERDSSICWRLPGFLKDAFRVLCL